jgi:hypothetical protein
MLQIQRNWLWGDGGIVDPIIRETRTVSKDGNTVTTNIFEDSQDGIRRRNYVL